MDRNELARRNFAAQQQMATQIRNALAAFAQDFASGKAKVIDRFAQQIQVDDLVLWHPPHDLIYHVTKIEPILQPVPGQPIGSVVLTLQLHAPVTFQVNQAAMQILKVGHQIDLENAVLTTPEGAQGDNIPPVDPDAPDYTAPPTAPPDADTLNTTAPTDVPTEEPPHGPDHD